MNKKLLVSVFLCLFVFSLGMFAQKKEEKSGAYELLLRTDIVDGFNGGVTWDFEPDNSAVLTTFNSHLINMGHVPPSPKSEALFFEIWCQYRYKWNTNTVRIAYAGPTYIISSPVIPVGIEVSLDEYRFLRSDTNIAGNSSTRHEREHIISKIGMWRDKVDFWWIWNTETQSEVDGEEAISILNKLIDSGFDVFHQTWGQIQGADWIYLRWVSLEVSGIVKN